MASNSLLSCNKFTDLFFPAIFKHHPENSRRFTDFHFPSVKGLVVRRFEGFK